MAMASSKTTQTQTQGNNNGEVPSRPVIDVLATSGDKVPDIFARETENQQFAADPTALPWIDCPVIDLSLLLSSSSQDELRKLHSALVSWGCFQLVNHGVSESFTDEVREVSKRFFELSLVERTKYMRGVNDPEGYGNDTILSQNVPHNWNDRLYLIVHPEDQRKLNLWPQTPSSFRENLHEFTMKVQDVHKVLIQAMEQCYLGLVENSLMEEYGEKMIIAARINYYPQCPFSSIVRAARAHSDASTMTILLQDKEVDGLQVLNDNNWFNVPIIPNALFVNVGDQMEIMSNGLYKSAVHRVVANPGRERTSIAMFFSPEADKEIGPLKQLLGQNNPPLYKTIKRYSALFFRYHSRGERPMTYMKI